MQPIQAVILGLYFQIGGDLLLLRKQSADAPQGIRLPKTSLLNIELAVKVTSRSSFRVIAPPGPAIPVEHHQWRHPGTI